MAPVNVALCPSGLVTVTLTVPAGFGGVFAVMVVEFTTETEVAATPPILTVAPETKLLPPKVTAVPPLVVPEVGLIDVNVGAGLLWALTAMHEPRAKQNHVNACSSQTAATLPFRSVIHHPEIQTPCVKLATSTG
jgi:hypothetical protein